ncbi:hypothetical protein NMG60_11007502 [Bertholletia excelsa]
MHCLVSLEEPGTVSNNVFLRPPDCNADFKLQMRRRRTELRKYENEEPDSRNQCLLI